MAEPAGIRLPVREGDVIVRTSLLLAVVTACCGPMLATPAQAKTTWNPTQELSGNFGSRIHASKGGTVASWIRADEYDEGPVRTAYYRGSKKGWTASAQVLGTVGARDSQMSEDGRYVMADIEGTGLVMAERGSKNSWSDAVTIAAGMYVRVGELSADANTVLFADFPDPHSGAGTLKLMTRPPGGAWSTPVILGTVANNALYSPATDYAALSADAGTVVWQDGTFALRATTKLADGTWSAPVLLRQFPREKYMQNISLSRDGTRLAWIYRYGERGVITSARTGTAWSTPSYVTSDRVESMALSPNGRVVAYVKNRGKLILRSRAGAAWGKELLMDTVKPVYTDFALTNKTFVWTYALEKRLRASVYAHGAWKTPVQLSSRAYAPALSASGRTVLWTSRDNRGVFSRTR